MPLRVWPTVTSPDAVLARTDAAAYPMWMSPLAECATASAPTWLTDVSPEAVLIRN